MKGSGDRVIDVALSETVEVDGVTVTGGHLPKSGDGAPGAPGGMGAAGADGGGVRNRGTLTLRNSAVVNNIAGAGGTGGTGTGASPSTEGAEGGLGFGGPGGRGGDGGGIFSDGNLTVANSIVRVNRTVWAAAVEWESVGTVGR